MEKISWCDKNNDITQMPLVVRYKYGNKSILNVHSWYYNKIHGYWQCISEAGIGYIDSELELP